MLNGIEKLIAFDEVKPRQKREDCLMGRFSQRPDAGWSASMLRHDLCLRAQNLARAQGHLYDLSAGSEHVVIFGCDEKSRHGNFHPASYARLQAEPEWARRLAKVHTASRRSRARHDWQWKELDSCCSSDALLMNIFCHPKVFDGCRLHAPIATLLGLRQEISPAFGVTSGVPLRSQAGKKPKADRTEIDLVLGDLFVEAKLTEGDFQHARPALVERYRDLEEVFDIDRLPRKVIGARALPPNVDPDDPTVNLDSRPARVLVAGYQLIRNVLAAYSSNASFCVLCDGRRQDLIESWYTIMSAVHVNSMSWRLKLLTWQELAGAVPSDMQVFLSAKYGIEAET